MYITPDHEHEQLEMANQMLPDRSGASAGTIVPNRYNFTACPGDIMDLCAFQGEGPVNIIYIQGFIPPPPQELQSVHVLL